MSTEIKTKPLTQKQARDLLWEQGTIVWKLDANQKELYNLSVNNPKKTSVWLCSRRLGKSYALCVIAIEACLKQKNAIVKYCAPQQKDVKNIINPEILKLIKDCPKKLKPVYKRSENLWYFPSTGSVIQLTGTDNGRAESIRGGSANLCIIDEAGFCDDLEYVVRSILLPTTTLTKGKIILSSTPPKNAGHEFIKFVEAAELDNALITKTIYDNPRLTAADIEEIANEQGGYESTSFKREYLCHIMNDEASTIVPEFTSELEAKVVKSHQRPPFYDGYVAMDLGMKDLTVVLFGYYDFLEGKIIIEDEFVINGAKFTTEALAAGIKQKEKEVFKDPFTGETIPPYLRFSDNNLIVINDLYRLHNITFIPTKKDDKEAALNNVRILIGGERIIINPKCKTLIYHLKKGTWAKNRKIFGRSADAGHFDAIDALIYLVRNVQQSKNPYPPGYNQTSRESLFYRYGQQEDNKVSRGIKTMLNLGNLKKN